MTATRRRLVAVLVALAALLIAEGASAGGDGQRLPAGTAYNAQGNPTYGFGPRVRVHPHDVIAGNSIIGRDPDPFIRGQILRAYHSGRQ
jgi:hypothetical protein